jgi:four helix bundle protein
MKKEIKILSGERWNSHLGSSSCAQRFLGTEPQMLVSRQIVRCGTSVGAQYREAHRARSDAEFISKSECVTQELDETLYWLDLLTGGGFVASSKLAPLKKEANELMSIFVASIRTAKNNKRR